MILLPDSEELTVKEFDFFRFAHSGTESEHSDETENIDYFDFEDSPENDTGIGEQDKDMSFDVEDQTISESVLEEVQKKRADAKAEAEKILSDAKKKADEILKMAETEAVGIKKKAYSDGLEEGRIKGYDEAYKKNKEELEAQTVDYLIELRDLIEQYKQIKDVLITQNVDELKDVTVSIAEKVIHVGLKTSGDVIKKMIISATEKLRYKEWARIYISKSESSLIIEGNSDLLKAMAHVSENIKIIAMDDAAPGTCIIELPDQVIDASSSTQIENIKSALRGVDINGGNSIV